jgi:uroporphyrinogen-III decarboxylase
MFLIEMAWGLENTYYMLQDHREEVEDIIAKLRASLRRYVEVVAASPAQVVIQYENTSSTLLSPDVFRRYCLPCLNEYADILTAAGKIFLVHMCGKLQAFLDDIRHGRFNGIIDIPPPPTGDLPLDEAADGLPEKVVIGGIDPTTFISRDAGFVRAEVADLIERIKPRRGVLLGSADTVPRGTPSENFTLIRNLVETVGACDFHV